MRQIIHQDLVGIPEIMRYGCLTDNTAEIAFQLILRDNQLADGTFAHQQQV